MGLRAQGTDLDGRVALVTGASRGLGLALARELAAQGASLGICARNEDQLQAAAEELRADGAPVEAVACDVSDRADVERFIDTVADRFGGLDVVVNNAGVITVGPLNAQTDEDVAHSMDVMFWGTYHVTMASLDHLRRSSAPRLVNITSVGGKIAVPHLLPYCAAKFAAVGLSETLHAELAREGVAVTTVVPGLMRTGSHVNALVKGRHRLEAAWFGALASFPATATSAAHAARRIVAATRRGDAEVILTWQAHLAVRLNGLAPGLTTRLNAMLNRALPSDDDGRGRQPELAGDTGQEGAIPPLRALGRRAASAYGQFRTRREASDGDGPQGRRAGEGNAVSGEDGPDTEEPDQPAQERPPQPKRKTPDVDQPGGEDKNSDNG